MTSEERKNEIRETGIMAGMTTVEIRDFIDEEFKAALLGPREDLWDHVHKIRWLVGHALPYARSDGIYRAHASAAARQNVHRHQEDRPVLLTSNHVTVEPSDD